jgi:hypothetical protein
MAKSQRSKSAVCIAPVRPETSRLVYLAETLRIPKACLHGVWRHEDDLPVEVPAVSSQQHAVMGHGSPCSALSVALCSPSWEPVGQAALKSNTCLVGSTSSHACLLEMTMLHIPLLNYKLGSPQAWHSGELPSELLCSLVENATEYRNQHGCHPLRVFQ